MGLTGWAKISSIGKMFLRIDSQVVYLQNFKFQWDIVYLVISVPVSLKVISFVSRHAHCTNVSIIHFE